MLAALLSLLIAAPVAAVDFTAAEKAKLKKGRTVVKLLPTSGKKGFYGGSGYALIDASVDEVWKVLTDWSAYPKMFPNTEVCEQISKKGNKTLLKMKIGHPVVNVRYHVETTADPEKKSLHFQLLSQYPHDIDSLTGYWRLFPQSGGRTLAAYVVSVKAPPGIVSIAGDDLANRAIKALLKIPGDIKRWIDGPHGKKYKK
ncbi:MAG: SRPBCC family protein [Deltaproteobacteria bacterium]|nr:SRPBCC family protein [Deltaproteobacteria bacterium]MBN2673784.1 SRPBCC family protein [Deltaproteobacteria bacterium]